MASGEIPLCLRMSLNYQQTDKTNFDGYALSDPAVRLTILNRPHRHLVLPHWSVSPVSLHQNTPYYNRLPHPHQSGAYPYPKLRLLPPATVLWELAQSSSFRAESPQRPSLSLLLN